MPTIAAARRAWTISHASDLYQVGAWGGAFYGINEKGNLCALPRAEGGGIDLKELVDELRRRGILPPLLLRFTDILEGRIVELNEAFAQAIEEYGYKGAYRGVYPVKVNQDRWVLDAVVRVGRSFHYGLEAGSKPELLAVMALMEDDDALIICNGYKDEEYVESALLACKLGRKCILVVEKLSELDLIEEVSRRLDVRPILGIRVKLSTRGSGRWESSAGDRAKFGLAPHEVLVAVDTLRRHGLLDCLELLHFHIGSQISHIRSIKNALREAGHFFTQLYQLGAPLSYMDVGGGLGVDYDGSQTDFSSSMNYSMQEYANDVIYITKDICDGAQVPHPTIVSESGRAVVAHHALLVGEVLGVSEQKAIAPPKELPEGTAGVVQELFDIYNDVSRKNLLEVYHDAVDYKEEVLQLFSLGHLSLEQRVLAESLFWGICHKIRRLGRSEERTREELEALERILADIYFINFSLFQSVPDSWAAQQLFPVVPLHRHDEEPTRRGVLADITCDSDGKIDRFIDRRDVKDVLELHGLKDDPYYLGIFLVGAYQESLGDLHNLFGNTNVVLVSMAQGGGYRIEHVEPGDSVTDVLHYTGHNRADLVARLRHLCENSLRVGRISLEDSREILRFYEAGLAGYTYLERE
ncbi:MAG: biosynthetic arginine decarboxylase [Myxococcota bacterium]